MNLISLCENYPRTALCKLTAEMCLHLGKLSNPGEAAKNVFDRLIDYMPLVSLRIVACLINQTVVSATSQ